MRSYGSKECTEKLTQKSCISFGFSTTQKPTKLGAAAAACFKKPTNGSHFQVL